MKFASSPFVLVVNAKSGLNTVADIIAGKTFDNGVLCSSPNSVVMDEPIAGEAKREFQQRGGYFLSSAEADQLAKTLVTPQRLPNPKMVGKTAMVVAEIAGIKVPARVETIRVMLCEFFRITSHLLFYGTYAQDVGSMSPVFYMFVDRQKAYDVIEAITGFRMHPAWYRIGGVAADLPQGWDRLVREFLDWMPRRLKDYEDMALKNTILKRRSIGIGQYNAAEAIEWGVTGAGLRATGFAWDYRKARPYSGYENFDFEIPIGKNGDVYDRCLVRVEEIRQSLRIIEQCLNNLPAGDDKARHPLTTPPIKDNTMQDIETLIHHFLNVSWGPVIPAGECTMTVEATKGLNSYYLTSDGGTMSYRTRIRTPSFAHLQMIPYISRGLMVPDLIAILASIDFVMADTTHSVAAASSNLKRRVYQTYIPFVTPKSRREAS